MNFCSDNKTVGPDMAVKILRIMRFYLFFLVLSVASAFASTTYSQSTALTLQLNNTPIEDVLNRIEEETEFRFLYNKKIVNVERKVNVIVDGKSITEVLDNIFKNSGISYTISDRQIVLNKKESPTSAQQSNRVTGVVTDE